MPVYQEGDEMVEAAEIGKTAPVVNITTRLASKPSSNTRIDDSKGGSPPLTQLSQQDESADQHLGSADTAKRVTDTGVFKAQGPLGSELPYNDFVNKSGFKGTVKRN